MFLIPFHIYNKSKLVINKLKPKSELQKEIIEKEKEIKTLKKQKADMKHLKELEDEREELFREVTQND